MRRKWVFSATVMLIITTAPRTARAITAGQVDTFSSGTVQGWAGGGGLANVATGGPAGAGDRYFQITSFNRLASFNATQWAGNYLSAGVLDVEMDLMNPNDVPLEMRVVLFGPTGGSSAGRWTSITPAIVPADDAWHRFTFSLRQPDLVQVLAGDSYAATIAGVSQLMIRHDTEPGAGGTPLTGLVGVDNIRAVPVPEPASALALSALLASGLARRRRR